MYQEYLHWRKMGFRAVTAFGITKYGWSFIMDYLNEE